MGAAGGARALSVSKPGLCPQTTLVGLYQVAALLKHPAQGHPNPYGWGMLLRTLWAPPQPYLALEAFEKPRPAGPEAPPPPLVASIRSRLGSLPLRRSSTLDPDRPPPGSPPASKPGFLRRQLSLTGGAAHGVAPFLGDPHPMSGRTVHNVHCIQMTRLARAGGVSQTPNQGQRRACRRPLCPLLREQGDPVPGSGLLAGGSVQTDLGALHSPLLQPPPRPC